MEDYDKEELQSTINYLKSLANYKDKVYIWRGLQRWAKNRGILLSGEQIGIYPKTENEYKIYINQN